MVHSIVDVVHWYIRLLSLQDMEESDSDDDAPSSSKPPLPPSQPPLPPRMPADVPQPPPLPPAPEQVVVRKDYDPKGTVRFVCQQYVVHIICCILLSIAALAGDLSGWSYFLVYHVILTIQRLDERSLSCKWMGSFKYNAIWCCGAMGMIFGHNVIFIRTAMKTSLCAIQSIK